MATCSTSATSTKYVVSSTLDEPTWENTRVVTGDVAAEVGRIKAEAATDIVTFGFGRLGRTLMDHGLLDEIRLWIHPFIIGSAVEDGRLFDHCSATRLDLVNTQTLESGIIILSYAVQHEGQ